MKKQVFALPTLFALCTLLVSCTTPPKVETPPAPTPPPALDAGRWELVCEDYKPVSYDLCDAISFPKYQGKTREEWEAYSLSVGRIDGSFITWAGGGTLSPDRRYLAYSSDKDCLEPDTLNNMSVFLLDMYSQKETVLLSGKGNIHNTPVRWLDETTLLCTTFSLPVGVTWDGDVDFVLCDVDGSSKPVVLEGNTDPRPFAANGRILAYITGEDRKGLRVVRVEEDGGVTELAQKDFDGYPVNGGGLSASGTLLVFPLRPSWDEVERQVCVWNLETGEIATPENPIPAVGTDVAAIWVNWDGEHPEVDFNISNAPDSNGHNELWRYVYEAQS